MDVKIAGSAGDAIQNTGVECTDIGAKGNDAKGVGIYWDSDLNSGYSQLGPFHISDCDRGFQVEGQQLRGAGFVRSCTTGLYFLSQDVATNTWLDVMLAGNTANVGGAVAGITYKRTAPLFMQGTVGYDPAIIAAGKASTETKVGTVDGAVAGDFVVSISHTAGTQIQWFGAITSPDTVTVRGFNPATSDIDVAKKFALPGNRPSCGFTYGTIFSGG